ncbi:hypothetical protein H1C71_040531, partial [Ictidomys tridecemlineatus]|uniref:Beta/alpha-defensin C-terminal domain-containing protein n=1 Tax=Ictidomys tridecemlineatus TaxID=43179 RepID=A0A287DFD9_ICTTR
MRLGVFLRVPCAVLQVLPGLARALSFERPCFLRGGICQKRGTPNCESFRGPCRAFAVCCKIR